MTPEDRIRAARTYVVDHHTDVRTANGVLWDLCDTLPDVLTGDTRDTYAARIQLQLRGVHA